MKLSLEKGIGWGSSVKNIAIVFMLIIMMIACFPFGKSGEAFADDSYTIATKVTNGTITPNLSVNSGANGTVSYSPINTTDYYLYRIMVDGGLQYLDSNGDGTPETGTAAMKTSFTFNNVTSGHAISVIYAPKIPTTPLTTPADVKVEGVQQYNINPFSTTSDFPISYTATVSIPVNAQQVAAQHAQYITGMTVSVKGTYDPNIDTSNLQVTSDSPYYTVDNYSAANGTLTVNFSLTADPKTVDWSKQVDLQITGAKVTNADARANAGGELVALGQYSGKLSYNAPVFGAGDVEFAGQSATPASIKIASSYKVKHYVESAYGSGGYVLKETEIFGGTAGTLVTPTQKTYDGFIFNSGVSDVSGGNIAADNSLVLDMFYDMGLRVTYDGNGNDGGTVPTDANLYELNDTITVPQDVPTKTGYTFKGWKIDSAYKPGASFVIDTAIEAHANTNGVITLKAQWEADKTANVKTGDDTDFTLPIILMIVAMAGMVTILSIRRRKA